jgi:hypothetical protein
MAGPYQTTQQDSKRAATLTLPHVLSPQQREIIMTQKPAHKSEDAAAMKDGKKPGPKDSPVQVRNAGKDAHADKPKDWDKQDEAVDESFPASDASAKY